MEIYRSKTIDKVRKTIFKYDLEIARVESEIALRKEKQYLLSCVSGKQAQRDVLVAKVEQENYEVFLYRLTELKKNLLRQVDLVASKYGGRYYKAFTMYFFQEMPIEEISKELEIPISPLKQLLKRMNYDTCCFLDKKKKSV